MQSGPMGGGTLCREVRPLPVPVPLPGNGGAHCLRICKETKGWKDTMKNDKETGGSNGSNKMMLGLFIGMILGAPIGVALHNLALGLACGVSLGLALGVALNSRSDEGDSKDDEK